MTFENQSLLLAKVSFLAVLTMLIVFAGTSSTNSQMQKMEVSGR
jgi:hypothetical protein